MVSSQLSGFQETLGRADRILKLVPERGPLNKENEDLLRASLVLSVAAMDAYFHEIIYKFVSSASEKGTLSRKAFELLFSTLEGKPEDKAFIILSVIKDTKDVRNRISTLVRGMTYQKSDQINRALEILGIAPGPFWKFIDSSFTTKIRESKQGRRYSSSNYLNEIVDRRDQIVHAADKWNGRKRLRPMTRDRAAFSLHFIKFFAIETDAFLEKKLK